MAMTKEEKSLYMKEWRAANKDKVSANFQKWKEENKESRALYMKNYLANYVDKPEAVAARFKRNLMNNYKIGPEQFNEMWQVQGGKCAICKIDMDPKGRNMRAVSVDHNHETGDVRGLLCNGCNRGLGNLKDCPAVLEAAAKYLREKGNYSKSPLLKD